MLSACSRIDSRPLSAHTCLTHIRPSNPEGLFLNEELVFYFNEELDPTSVTNASVEIRSDAGRLARGELRVESDRVRFVPAAVLAADLSDGGYLPGTRYSVTLAGFPRPEGVRSARGDVLEKTWVWAFRTVQVSRPRTSLVFEDRMQDRVGLLRLFPSVPGQVGLIRAQDSIYLACDKPIDPSTVRADAFLLTFLPTDSRPTGARPVEPVGLRVRVIENGSEVGRRPRPAIVGPSATSEAWDRERRACLIEVTPERRLAAGTWVLKLKPDTPETEPVLRDFGGKPVLLAEPSASFRISVDGPSAEAGRGKWNEEFENRRLFSPVAVPGYDGTAFWSESGRVEVRYPAAAGSGEDGAVNLGLREDRIDVKATSIDLPKDAVCRLRAEPGLVVLRCQGRMSICGELIREAPWDPQTTEDPTLPKWENLCAVKCMSSRTLSQWLSDTRAGEGNWTVLIAGGDLSIDGSLSTTTPLLLVAGGRIRVSGSVHGVSRQVRKDSGTVVASGCIYLLGEGGGLEIGPLDPSPAPILVDEPQGANPLRIPLRFAALSGPIPPGGEVLRWLSPEAGGSPDRPQGSGTESGGRVELPICGSWKVRYLRELSTVPREASDLAFADSPVLLDAAGPIQFLVELDVEPGKPGAIWNPPWVDYVHLAWEQPPPRDGSSSGDR